VEELLLLLLVRMRRMMGRVGGCLERGGWMPLLLLLLLATAMVLFDGCSVFEKLLGWMQEARRVWAVDLSSGKGRKEGVSIGYKEEKKHGIKGRVEGRERRSVDRPKRRRNAKEEGGEGGGGEGNTHFFGLYAVNDAGDDALDRGRMVPVHLVVPNASDLPALTLDVPDDLDDGVVVLNARSLHSDRIRTDR
jgi:hypothetical protein